MNISVSKLKEFSTTIRYFILRSTTAAGSGHPTSSLSATDLLATLMFGGFFHAHLEDPDHPANDRLIFSKGHASPLFYALYATAHQLSEEQLLQLRKFDSPLEGHPTMRFPFTEAATGSLGQGLGIGLGMALNAKYLDKLSYRTFVLLGDSEMAEGSIWETVQLAAYYEANSLIGILDMNGLGQRGHTMVGKNADVYAKRFEAFGWRVEVVDGHDHKQIANAYRAALSERYRPTMIIGKTVKGKGVSFLENKDGWHGKALNVEECQAAIEELGPVKTSLRGVIFKPPHEMPQLYDGSIKVTRPRYGLGEMVATREAYGEALVSLFPDFRNMVVLDAEVSNSSGAGTFKKAYKDRFFEMFIAEQNMVSVALGLSRRGKIPFVSTFAAFLTRAADQIRMSQYSEPNIKFVGSHSGVSIGEDGSSQMGLEDIALFRSQPECVVLYPADAVATVKLVKGAAEHKGNVYLRTTRAKTPVIYREGAEFPIGGSKVLREGSHDDITIVSAGITLYEALKAHELLLAEGIVARVIDLYSIQPLDGSTLKKAASETRAVITIEDHYEGGGIGEAVSAALSESKTPVFRCAVKKMPRSGNMEELLAYEEISAETIAKKVKTIVKKKLVNLSV